MNLFISNFNEFSPKPIILELLGSTKGVLQQFQGMKGAVPDVNALQKVLNEAGAGALSQ